MNKDIFSAGDQFVGYLYQMRYALYLLLTKEEEAELSIEKLDDVEFDNGGNPVELVQFKHSCNYKASLQDSSADLWKPIRIWSNRLRKREISLPRTSLMLITTGDVKDNYIAALLGTI